jgi:putative ABC transport system substrate-binding protein
MDRLQRREFITLLGGAVAGWPLAARAQQPNAPVIGFLDWARPAPSYMEAFRAGLAEAGFIEGRNLSIEHRWANGDFGQLRGMAADLVRRQVAVIVASGVQAPVRAAMAATSTIPIVFYYGGDAVKDRFVASLSRPGGNITGITAMNGELTTAMNGELTVTRLDLLLQMVPHARKVGFLWGSGTFFPYEEQLLAAGHALGVEIMIVECRDDRDFEAAVVKMVEGGAGAMILSAWPFTNRNKLVSLAALHNLPATYPFRSLVRIGGLMSYDTDVVALGSRIGSYYVARILKGMKPADLPVEQPTKFDLVINLTTAKALGLQIPDRLLALADEVIE